MAALWIQKEELSDDITELWLKLYKNRSPNRQEVMLSNLIRSYVHNKTIKDLKLLKALLSQEKE